MNLEEHIIQHLQKGAMPKVELINQLQKTRPSTTKQGVYKALRILEKEGKVILQSKDAALNLNWVLETQEFLALAQHHYYNPSGKSFGFLNVSDKSRLIYNFTSLAELDSFWNQVLYILNEAVSPKEPLFAYNPHQWFFYARTKYEENLINSMKKNHRPLLVTLYFQDALNKTLKREFNPDLAQYAFADKLIGNKPNYYFNVIGDYFIECLLDIDTAKALDLFFKTYKTFNNDAKKAIELISKRKSKHKMIISRNQKKTSTLRRLLSKRFAIKI